MLISIDSCGKILFKYGFGLATGGFTDELGKYQHSGHNYTFGYLEVLNEMDYIAGPKYIKWYDGVTTVVRSMARPRGLRILRMDNGMAHELVSPCARFPKALARYPRCGRTTRRSSLSATVTLGRATRTTRRSGASS